MYLTHLLHRAVQLQPHRPLTVCADRERTAQEVVERVARLAGSLHALGVGEGDRVGILAFNCDRYYETLMATWWIGAIANPLNCRWSSAEVTAALDDAGTDVLFVDDEALSVMNDVPTRTLVHIGEGATPEGCHSFEKLVAEGECIEDSRVGDLTPAALLYTGGTTGTPKGVVHTHHSMLMSSFGTHYLSRAYEPGGGALVIAPLFHIAALLGMVSQSIAGGTLVFEPKFEAGTVLALVEKHRLTTITVTSTMVQALCSHPDLEKRELSSLVNMIYGAAPMPEAVLTQAMSAFPNVDFCQGYGMTETAVITVLTGADHRAGGRRLTSAGRTSPHAENRIVDPDGVELPRGVVGEIVSRGDHVMQGYWNRPEETAAVLRGGWLHTGDLGYMDDEGYLYIVDRAKDMIITGGENVFSTEVENAISHHPAVADCAVIGVPDRLWGERVHAVVVLQDGATLSLDELRLHVKTLIAGFKSPRSLDFVDKLPRTATGKTSKLDLRTRFARSESDLQSPEENQ